MKSTLTHLINLALICTVLTACGASKIIKSPQDTDGEGSSILDSRASAYKNQVDPGSITECNGFADRSLDLNAQLRTHYENYPHGFIEDEILLKFYDLPSVILEGDSAYLQIFAWYLDDIGQQIYSSALPMVFMQKFGRQIINSSRPVNVISQNSIQNAIDSFYSSSSGMTPSNFFDSHIILIRGVDLTYKAMTFSFYDEAAGDEAIATKNALIPAFSLSPDIYAINHPISLIHDLHPFASYRGQGYAAEDFAAQAKQFCSGF